MSSLRDEIARKYIQEQRIKSVLFEITHRCPCDCIHCLLVKNVHNELSLDEIIDLLDQLRDEGAFELGITGGEPFLRRDLPHILKYARKKHFMLYLLTTGIFIEKKDAELLDSIDIQQVEISLLGSKPETHDAIMRYPGAFEKMIRGVEHLNERSIPVKFKTTLLRQNWKELHAMAALAKRYGAEYATNVYVIPQINGNTSPQQHALTEKELQQIDFSLVYGGLIPGEDNSPGALLKCLAGITTAGISPQGDIYPCIVLPESLGNIRERSLRDIWHDNPLPFLTNLRKLKPDEVTECIDCQDRSSCKRCPGIAYLETGNVRSPSLTACMIAKTYNHSIYFNMNNGTIKKKVTANYERSLKKPFVQNKK